MTGIGQLSKKQHPAVDAPVLVGARRADEQYLDSGRHAVSGRRLTGVGKRIEIRRSETVLWRAAHQIQAIRGKGRIDQPTIAQRDGANTPEKPQLGFSVTSGALLESVAITQ